MSDDSTASKPVDPPPVEPVETSDPDDLLVSTSSTSETPELVEPGPPAAADTAAIDSVVADPAATDVAVEEPVAPGPALAAASAVSAQQPVYVQAPVPPKKRGNRGIGVLLSVVGAILYAGLYAVVAAFILDLSSADLFGPNFTELLRSYIFWVPVAVFLIGLILMTLLLNRSGWWAHVLGSLILAVVVYFASIGLLLVIGNLFHAAPRQVTFAGLAIHPLVIASAIVAREVSIWIGLAIAARGRRVKARNAEARSAFEREQAAKNSEYAGPIAGV